MKKLLTSKPFPENALADLGKKGIATDYVPLIEITPQSHKTLNIDHYDCLVFTSANAVSSVQISLNQNTLTASISGETAKRIREKFGFEPQITAPNAEKLAEKILEIPAQKILFLKGKISLNILKEKLTEKKNFEEIEVYNTRLLAPKIQKKYDFYAFFSPSAVESFVKAGNEIPQKSLVFAIGNTTKKTLKSFFKNPVLAPKSPSISALIDLISS